ncbi:hypothetical protein E2C01_062602 [Portunus trituberculatus]|uniref:Uncharacterized protein n=1 Tax=Portunus trituberculatus TaxID=210409 RepID=A0A5B7HBK3_PORTR|nr:hypothetical protein [Portunus trituberculatus]
MIPLYHGGFLLPSLTILVKL